MIRSLLILAFSVLLTACPGSSPNTEDEQEIPTIDDPIIRTGPFNMLVFSHTAGFRHVSIEAGKQMLQDLASANDFEVTLSEDPNDFTTNNLSQFEAVFFLNTTSNVLNDEQQTAFESFIRSGGAFVGVHSAADTEHDWPFYGELVGSYFLAHPVHNQPGTIIIEDTEHPTVRHLAPTWNVLPVEEFYSFKSNPREDVRVLTRIDESSYMQEPNTSCDPSGNPTFPEGGFSGIQGDHPMTWCHDKFSGRAWYTALGHEISLYQDPNYQRHVLNGIFVATRRIEASCDILPKPADAPEYIEPEPYHCQNQVTP
ncbi:MAG: ThuA domain-containing protein [Gammaproteobacteria bacterium]|nr:ThuA domain-containing protein [Gammaproteobacteria bacterium]